MLNVCTCGKSAHAQCPCRIQRRLFKRIKVAVFTSGFSVFHFFCFYSFYALLSTWQLRLMLLWCGNILFCNSELWCEYCKFENSKFENVKISKLKIFKFRICSSKCKTCGVSTQRFPNIKSMTLWCYEAGRKHGSKWQKKGAPSKNPRCNFKTGIASGNKLPARFNFGPAWARQSELHRRAIQLAGVHEKRSRRKFYSNRKWLSNFNISPMNQKNICRMELRIKRMALRMNRMEVWINLMKIPKNLIKVGIKLMKTIIKLIKLIIKLMEIKKITNNFKILISTWKSWVNKNTHIGSELS